MGEIPILAANEYLMEIKCSGAIPCRLSRALSELGIFPVSFSKAKAAYTVLNGLNRNNAAADGGARYAFSKGA
jgi:hypothetical protein